MVSQVGAILTNQTLKVLVLNKTSVFNSCSLLLIGKMRDHITNFYMS